MPGPAPATETRGLAAALPSTEWKVVMQAGEGDTPLSRAALEVLCQVYWSPLYAFLRRNHPELSPHDAQDLVQGFLARLIERGDLDTLGPDEGSSPRQLLGLPRAAALANQ